jgi:hypothetical protein
MRLIDADALKKDISGAKKLGIEAVAYYIDQQPTAVVRCGECKWYGIYYAKKDGTPDKRYRPSVCLRGKYAKRRDPDWFCADGERSEA